MPNPIRSVARTIRWRWVHDWRWRGGARRVQAAAFRPHTFICASQTEWYRTAGYGGELAPLGAFLFLLRPSDIVWDVGSSVGLFTVHAADIAQRVVAIEPDPATVERLRQNVAVNGQSSRVDCLHLALGNTQGTVSLATDGLDGNAPAIADLGRHRQTVSVRLDTADALVAAGTIRPTVLKIDVEGAEAMALEGAKGILSGPERPRLVFMEVHPRFLPQFGGDAEDVERILRETGYHLLATRAREDQYHVLATAIE